MEPKEAKRKTRYRIYAERSAIAGVLFVLIFCSVGYFLASFLPSNNILGQLLGLGRLIVSLLLLNLAFSVWRFLIVPTP